MALRVTLTLPIVITCDLTYCKPAKRVGELVAWLWLEDEGGDGEEVLAVVGEADLGLSPLPPLQPHTAALGNVRLTSQHSAVITWHSQPLTTLSYL